MKKNSMDQLRNMAKYLHMLVLLVLYLHSTVGYPVEDVATLQEASSNLDDMKRKEEAFLQDIHEAMMNDEAVEQEDEYDEELLDDETEDLYAAREMTRAKPYKKNKMKPKQSLYTAQAMESPPQAKGKGKKGRK